ncbi:hypothetical protein F4604DRAFT_760003 [Suillus subluteus]|nr:hypothetical protein F4604DRAFT_760003 [Suillus subluteus]
MNVALVSLLSVLQLIDVVICSDDNNSVYGSSVNGHIAIQPSSSKSDDCVKAEGRIREILFKTAMSPSLFSADGVQLSRIAYDHGLHIEEMKVNLLCLFFFRHLHRSRNCATCSSIGLRVDFSGIFRTTFITWLYTP